MKQVTSNEQKERLRYVSDRLTSAEELLRQALNGGGGSNPRPPQPTSAIELYHSDSCSGSLTAIVDTPLAARICVDCLMRGVWKSTAVAKDSSFSRIWSFLKLQTSQAGPFPSEKETHSTKFQRPSSRSLP